MKKTYLTYLASAVMAMATLTGCQKDELRSESVFANGMGTQKSEYTVFDEWLAKNYIMDYNIQFNYLYVDREANQAYNVVPAEYKRAQAIAYLVKYMWLDVYTEVQAKSMAQKEHVDLNDGSEKAEQIKKDSKTFLRTYSPRVIQLFGSYEWNSNNSQVMGTAEQGMKVLLFGVNELDLDQLRFEADNPFASKSNKPLDMNYWFFHTMHHEFCHILTQKKDYDPAFRVISTGHYHATDWINVKDKTAGVEGFVSGYASGEYNEDFAETYATYVTLSDKGWKALMDNAGEDGGAYIQQKLDIVREYFQETWGIDLDMMRDIIQRRSAEVVKMDLHNIDFTK